MPNKSELRKKFIASRKALTQGQRDLYGSYISDLFRTYFQEHPVKSVHLFLSIIRHHEIDTQGIIDFLRTQGVDIIVSKSDFETTTLNHYLLDESTRIEENGWGIPEPINARPVTVDSIDLVLIPLVAFDFKGFRIGYGKGFYDKFLAKCNPRTIKIGLSFFPPIETIHPGSHDIPMDECITPDRIYSFWKDAIHLKFATKSLILWY